MIRRFDEEYKDLMIEDDGSERRVLKSIEEEYVPFPERRCDNITLFVLSQRDPGFIENYCLSDDNKKKLNDLRDNMNKNPDLLMNVILVLDKYLPISFEEFNGLNLFEKERILVKTRNSLNDEDLELFNKVFNDLSTKYKTKELTLDETESK